MTPDDPLQRFRLKRCINCGYDLRGSWDSERCPECGEGCRHALLIQPRRERWSVFFLVGYAVVLLLFASLILAHAPVTATLMIALAAFMLAGTWWFRLRRHGGSRGGPFLVVTSSGVHARESGRGTTRFIPLSQCSGMKLEVDDIVRRGLRRPYWLLIGIDHDKPRPLRHTPVSDAEFLPNRLWIRFYALPEEADALGAELIDRLETHTAENGV